MNNQEVRSLINKLSLYDYKREDLQLDNNSSEPIVVVSKARQGFSGYLSKSKRNEDSDLLQVTSTLFNLIKAHPELSQKKTYIADVIRLSNQLRGQAELLKNPNHAYEIQEKVAEIVYQVAFDCWNNSNQSFKKIIKKFPFGNWENVLKSHFEDRKGRAALFNEILCVSLDYSEHRLETKEGPEKEKEKEKEPEVKSDQSVLQTSQLKSDFDLIKKVLHKKRNIQWIQIQGLSSISREEFDSCLIPCTCLYSEEKFAVSPWLILKSSYLQKLSLEAKKNLEESFQFHLPHDMDPLAFQCVNEGAPHFRSLDMKQPKIVQVVHFLKIEELCGINFIEEETIPIELSMKIFSECEPKDFHSVMRTSRVWNQVANESLRIQTKTLINSLIKNIDSEKYPEIVRKLIILRNNEINDLKSIQKIKLESISWLGFWLQKKDLQKLEECLREEASGFFLDFFELVRFVSRLQKIIQSYIFNECTSEKKKEALEHFFKEDFDQNRMKLTEEILKHFPLEEECLQQLEDCLEGKFSGFFLPFLKSARFELDRFLSKLSEILKIKNSMQKIQALESFFKENFYQNKLCFAKRVLEELRKEGYLNYKTLWYIYQMSFAIDRYNMPFAIIAQNGPATLKDKIPALKMIILRLVNNSLSNNDDEDFIKAKTFIENLHIIEEDLKAHLLTLSKEELRDWAQTE